MIACLTIRTCVHINFSSHLKFKFLCDNLMQLTFCLYACVTFDNAISCPYIINPLYGEWSRGLNDIAFAYFPVA